MPRFSPGNGKSRRRRQRRSCPALGRNGLHGSSGRATRRNFSRDCATGWAASRRVRQLPKLTRDLFLITAELMREKPGPRSCAARRSSSRRAFLNYWSEDAFNRRWATQDSRPAGEPETSWLGHMPQPARQRWRRPYDRNQDGLEPDPVERSPPDAQRPPLARPALVSHPDDRRDAQRRRVALVCARHDPADLRRRAPLRRDRRGASAAVAGICIFRALKRTSRRKRPCDIEPHCWSAILPPDKYSFPSGHSITAFAIAISIGLFYPELQISLLAAALLIASSRIVLGMHFLSDVLAGSAIGVLLGFTSFHVFALL